MDRQAHLDWCKKRAHEYLAKGDAPLDRCEAGMTNDLREALEACPFCGNALTAKRGKINPYARCETADCFGRRMPVVSLDVAADVEAWNRRAALSQPSPAGREATDAMIEAGAQALANGMWHPPQKLSAIPPYEADRLKIQAAIVLKAALALSPQDAGAAVAWRYRWAEAATDADWQVVPAEFMLPTNRAGYEIEPLYAAPPAPGADRAAVIDVMANIYLLGRGMEQASIDQIREYQGETWLKACDVARSIAPKGAA